ncbi:DUF58 domain-containing protein [Parvibaculum sp.]|jgi:uncharacterized protein (DUF58 family)|uniref:DUF58 domain-containing protein n=1 Tax=Parvibaculum sp. TaxID=2024848 RepID=UPI000C37636F|nr:DUF58 domain-containing protein [Parvibaculum sp.]MAM94317.1 DUF58 domain-containing protein [Parvibaculum sp.]HCX66113.1 DUF58 domain-containing protein [Rhodobiaceae bacterium]|tara:strand:- start:4111 stop:5052 length:942 start_codon:yes stop_codon:yes gene_type:complete
MSLTGSHSASSGAIGLREQAEALAEVMPPLVTEAEHVASTIAQGVHGRRRTGMGETFWQFRRYREGDSAASVDWRHSARSTHLFVRETEREAAESIWIWRDSSASMDYASDFAPCTKRDRATVIALALSSLLVQGGESVAPLGQGFAAMPGRSALRRMAHALIDMPDSDAPKAESLPPPEHLPRYSQVVLISDFLSPAEEIAERIKRYAADGIRGHMIQVLDPAEEDLPFSGRTEFEGVEDDLRLMVGRAQNLREAYHQRLEIHRNRIVETARRIDFTFATHRTDRSPQTALLALYGALSGAIAARKPPRPGM